jgi:hypothetical protein
MESVKQFFDVLDYTTLRVVLYVLMVVGAWALIHYERSWRCNYLNGFCGHI